MLFFIKILRRIRIWDASTPIFWAFLDISQFLTKYNRYTYHPDYNPVVVSSTVSVKVDLLPRVGEVPRSIPREVFQIFANLRMLVK